MELSRDEHDILYALAHRFVREGKFQLRGAEVHRAYLGKWPVLSSLVQKQLLGADKMPAVPGQAEYYQMTFRGIRRTPYRDAETELSEQIWVALRSVWLDRKEDHIVVAPEEIGKWLHPSLRAEPLWRGLIYAREMRLCNFGWRTDAKPYQEIASVDIQSSILADPQEKFESVIARFDAEAAPVPQDGNAVIPASVEALGTSDDSCTGLLEVDPDGLKPLLHPAIQKSSLRLFRDDHLRQAVLDACIAVFELIRERTSCQEDGKDLVGKVFSLQNPMLVLSEVETDSGKNDQIGFMQMLQGAYQGIRNPKAHTLNHDLNPAKAAQYLVFFSLLARRVSEARLVTPSRTAGRSSTQPGLELFYVPTDKKCWREKNMNKVVEPQWRVGVRAKHRTLTNVEVCATVPGFPDSGRPLNEMDNPWSGQDGKAWGGSPSFELKPSRERYVDLVKYLPASPESESFHLGLHSTVMRMPLDSYEITVVASCNELDQPLTKKFRLVVDRSRKNADGSLLLDASSLHDVSGVGQAMATHVRER